MQEKHKSRATGKVTLADVARLADVSPITVSRVVNTPDKVAKASREKIERAIDELGYIPNRAAKALATSKTNTIAVLIPSVAHGVFSAVTKGIYDSCTASNYEVIFANSYYSILHEEKLLLKLLSMAPDGVIVTGLDLSERIVKRLKNAAIPVVQIMDVGHADPLDMNIGFSHFTAGASMARHLAERGYQKIGFIGAQMGGRSQRRLRGFLAALAHAGINASDWTVTSKEAISVALGGQLLGQLLERVPQLDAVFCSSDELAFGAIYEAQRRGIEIPSQLAIAGFNDLDGAQAINPGLTTIRTPLYQIGRQAATLLLRKLDGEDIVDKVLDLGTELVVRQST
ncbi:MAG: LacI family DNA-binding transcriptional regulator [Pseudomonadales bacterium]